MNLYHNIRTATLALTIVCGAAFFFSAPSTTCAAMPLWQNTPKADKEDKAEEKKAKEKADDEKAQADDQHEESKDDKPSKRKKSDSKKDSTKKKSDGDDDDQEDEDVKTEEGKETRKKSTPRRVTAKSVSKQDPKFIGAFKPIIGSVSDSTVRIMGGRRQIAMGAVIDADGYILTKASEMRGTLSCKLPDGSSHPAKVIGIDKDSDFALLKIEATDLPIVHLSTEMPPQMGRWLVTPLGQGRGYSVGVVAVNAREIPQSGAFVGITMSNLEKEPGVRILTIVPESPADNANLWPSDIVQKIDDVVVEDIVGLRETLGQCNPDQTVVLTVRRGKETIKIPLTLADRDTASPDNMRSNSQNQMGSNLSRRSKDFELAFQHDSLLTANQVGGPIVDLSGRVVGFNIARAGRVSCLTIPASKLPEIVQKLKTGEFAPETVNAEKIVEQEKQIKNAQSRLTRDLAKQDSFEEKLKLETARLDELQRMQKEINERIKVMEEGLKASKKSRDLLQLGTRKQERALKMMEQLLEGLKTGRRY